MDGKIWLESEINEGAVFYFTIPAANATLLTHNTYESSQRITLPDLRGKTILIVEDDETNYFLLEEILKNLNATILRAVNGRDAIQKCRDHSEIELVFLDLKLPDLDGFKAAPVIKNLRNDLPVIAQTAYTFSDEKQRALESGCDAFLPKPLDFDEIASVLRFYIR
jgi:CheY-like chemotaxis protein